MSETTRCVGCERAIRPQGTSKDDFPGTVVRATKDTCHRCYNARGGVVAAPVDIDSPCVLTKTLLRPSTYRVFRAKAEQMGTTVDVLLSRMADAAVKPRTAKARSLAATQLDNRIRALNAAGMNDSEIARHIGKSSSWVSKQRSDLGLPKRAAQGRKKTTEEKAA